MKKWKQEGTQEAKATNRVRLQRAVQNLSGRMGNCSFRRQRGAERDADLLPLSEIITPVFFSYLTRRVCPFFESLGLHVVYFVQVIVSRAEDVC